jgi:hypothetical protein
MKKIEEQIKKYEEMFNQGLEQKKKIETQLIQLQGAIMGLRGILNDEDNERSSGGKAKRNKDKPITKR